MANRTQRHLESIPPALAEWQSKEAKWKEESNAWVYDRLLQHFQSESGSNPVTAGDMLKLLDADITMPPGWARLVKSDTASYRERYATVRNTLEVFARKRIVVMGTTVNSKGRDKVTTYATPHDASAEWSIQIEGDPSSVKRARQGIKDWLSLDGSVLDGIRGMIFTRRSGGTKNHGTVKAVSVESSGDVTKPHRGGRGRRNTRGAD